MNAHEKIAAKQERQAQFDALKKADPEVQLFEELGAPRIEQTAECGPVEVFDYRCTVCKATTHDHPDLIEGEDFESFGGTTEGYERCAVCGVTSSWADLSAVI